MTDSPRRDGSEPTQPLGNNYPGYIDPAYANQSPYGPTYQPPAAPDPTQRLPPYSPYGNDPYATGQYGAPYPQGDPQQPPPEGPRSPQWLWLVAGFAVLIVVGLVIALVIANSSRQQTVVAPAPSMPEPTATTTTRTPTTTSRTPTPIVPPLPTAAPPTEPTTTPSDATETVTYNVTGEGRAINITYTDSGGVPQTEFNVALPWSKQVELTAPAQSSARISIINIGREVSCSVTINGVPVEQRSGSGLTICGLG